LSDVKLLGGKRVLMKAGLGRGGAVVKQKDDKERGPLHPGGKGSDRPSLKTGKREMAFADRGVEKRGNLYLFELEGGRRAIE